MAKLTVSTDKQRLTIDKIHDYLCNHSYWAQGRTLIEVEATIEHSLCFGIYDQQTQLAFARVVTDTVSFAYLADVIVFEPNRGQGLSKLLLKTIFESPNLSQVNWLLRTDDAHTLYQQFGFSMVEQHHNYLRMAASTTN